MGNVTSEQVTASVARREQRNKEERIVVSAFVDENLIEEAKAAMRHVALRFATPATKAKARARAGAKR